jgi:hypothetical protein
MGTVRLALAESAVDPAVFGPQDKLKHRTLRCIPGNHNRPSWASMMERQIDRPMPMPPDFVVKSGLNMRPTSCEPIPFPVSATDIMTPPPS